MENDPATDEIQKINALIQRMETLGTRIDEIKQECIRMFDELRTENDLILSGLKLHLHQSVTTARQFGVDIIPDIPIEDRKLKTAWVALLRYPEGATADQVAEDLRRHRTTVSTYLNMLELMAFVTKERRGHEIYYRAVINQDTRKI
jgi:hypothetical protein